MVPSAMALTMAEEWGIRTFLEPLSLSGPPTRPVFMMYTSIGCCSSSSRKRLPWPSWCIGKNGLVPGTRRNTPSSSLPPAAVPVVSPSMKKAAACGPSSLATAGITFSLRFSTSRKSACSIEDASAASMSENENTARPFLV